MPLFQSRRPKAATANGTYLLNGSQFKIRAGDPIPEGAEVTYKDGTTEVVTADEVFSRKLAGNNAPRDGDGA